MRRSAWGAALVSLGLLAACGTKSAPSPSTTSATSTASGGTDWASLCKLADARAKTCNVKNNLVAECAAHAADCTDVYDKSSYPVLSKCLADADCNACAVAAKSSPSPAGKVVMGGLADHEKRCGQPAIDSVMHPLFSDTGAKGLTACEAKSDCNEEFSCLATLDPKQMNLCQETLGLLYPNMLHGTMNGDAPSNIPPPPPPTDLTGQPAPEISADAVGSSKIPSMASLKGKVALVVFFATYSTSSTKLVTDVDAFVKKNSKKGVVAIGVSVDDGMPAVQAFQQKSHVKMPLAFDSKKATAQAYSPSGLPTLYVVDRKGMVSDIEVMNIDMAKLAKAL